jgi:hypothetical protein
LVKEYIVAKYNLGLFSEPSWQIQETMLQLHHDQSQIKCLYTSR